MAQSYNKKREYGQKGDSWQGREGKVKAKQNGSSMGRNLKGILGKKILQQPLKWT